MAMQETRYMLLTDVRFALARATGHPIICLTFEDAAKKLCAFCPDMRDHRLRTHMVCFKSQSDIDSTRIDTARRFGMNLHDFVYSNDTELRAAIIDREFEVKWGCQEYLGWSRESNLYPRVLSWGALQQSPGIRLSYNYNELETAQENNTETLGAKALKNCLLLTAIKSLISKRILAIFRKAKSIVIKCD